LGFVRLREVSPLGVITFSEETMIIKSVRVQNFRCIRDETLPCDRLTALIGPNGSGKSSFLRALDLFYASSAKYAEDDFYNNDTSEDIIVTISFVDLTEEEQKLFQKYVEDGELTVEKVMKWPASKGSQKYYGTSLQNPDFDPFRAASGGQLRAEYKKLHEGKYSAFPSYTNKEEAEKALQDWEQSNPDECERQRDRGQFFGFKEVGEAHLERYTRYIAVPAVRDASDDAEEAKGSSLTQIMDLVVRSVLAQKKEIVELQEGTQKQYEEIVDPAKLVELQTLEKHLSDTLKTYVPDAGVNLDWVTEDAINIPMPKADIKLIEDEYPSSVQRTGHGLQRAFILTMLQHLTVSQAPARADTDEESDETGKIPKEKPLQRVPNIIIGMEEPELYQHPNRQRHLSNILLQLATGSIKGVVDCTQVIYATHSPLFVDIRRFDNVRVLHKVQDEAEKPKETKVIFSTLNEVAKIVENADGKPEGTYSGSTLAPRLQTLMTPWMNEGFFANVAVLVEGEEDRAAVLGIASTMGYDLESMGISVIPCMGKNNLDKPTAIFRKLNIKVYAIWDGDHEGKNANKEDNHRLLRLFGQPVEDWPDKISEHFACFKRTLSYTLRTEIGNELYNDCLDDCCDRLCLGKRKWARKNVQAIQEIIKEARRKGRSSKTLEGIISKIMALR
jgi:predicted ATP-dependent endonuclease of OLD family